MAATDPPWKAAVTVCGLRMAPSNIATYAAEAESHTCASAFTGSEKNTLHALSTTGSLNAISRPPSTTAATMARKVTTAGLPSVTALMIEWLRVAVRRAGGPAAGGCGVSGGAGGTGCSLLMAHLRHDAHGAPPARRSWRTSGTTLMAARQRPAEPARLSVPAGLCRPPVP